jgi:hypothetical protein
VQLSAAHPAEAVAVFGPRRGILHPIRWKCHSAREAIMADWNDHQHGEKEISCFRPAGVCQSEIA